jgi:glycosyltransferase involved in cell wall biosynthesis
MITYNHAPYIAKAIEGVLQQQTTFPFELVIGEDCSTDNTREIVREYQRRFSGIVRVIMSETNVGMMKNGYRTVMASQGKYVAFCEGDDYWHHPGKLQKQVDYLEIHPDCGLVCSDYDVVYFETGKRISGWNKKYGRTPSQLRDVADVLRGGRGIQTCTVVARRDAVFRVVDSDPNIFQNENQPAGDNALWVGMFLLGGIGYIDESLATYNRPTESATQSRDVRKILRMSILMKEQMLYLIDKYDLPVAERARHLEDLWRRKLKLAFYEKDAEMAAESKKNLRQLSSVEQLQCWGAKNSYLNSILRPALRLICRSTIPSAK